jgi:nitrogen regulatory protein PII 1
MGGGSGMRIVRAIIRPDREEEVVNALESAGVVSLTKMDVFGRGQQKGVQVGNTVYSELPKIMFTIVIEESKLEATVAAIQKGAKTGQHGDGKIFISPVDSMYTVRTGQKIVE